MENSCGVAAASLGQIVFGYAVIFGLGEKINLKSLQPTELRDFLNFFWAARQVVEKRFGKTVIFEHGAAKINMEVSCGVNCMHLHVVPYNGTSLVNRLEQTFECKARAAKMEELLMELNCWAADTPYFWIEEGGKYYLFSYGAKRESQVVRRAIAKELGKEDQWNWREYPTQSEAERVAKELLGQVSSSLSITELSEPCPV